jgi:glycosyltransferase involved in cell wall biosynthesis
LAAEFGLAGAVRKCDSVLCFHGLPPLLPMAGKVYVFLQNRLYLGQVPFGAFGWRTRQRLRVEQGISRWLRHRVGGYAVQTPSMARELKAWFGSRCAPIEVLPFAPPAGARPVEVVPQWDFIYVADGEAHKNHRKLIEAWSLLAQEGLRPSLALTLSARDRALAAWIAERAQRDGLDVVDLGVRPHAQVAELYASASALIFPSLGESFGLPLVEARQAGLPILAAELDYVRDVCEPAETFDPMSSVSIARAVRRSLNQAELPLTPTSASNFLASFIEIS